MIAKDLHVELEHIMSTQMRSILSQLEEHIARAASEGRSIVNQHVAQPLQNLETTTSLSDQLIPGWSQAGLNSRSSSKVDVDDYDGSSYHATRLSTKNVDGGHDYMGLLADSAYVSLSKKFVDDLEALELDEDDSHAEMTRIVFNSITLLMLVANAIADGFEVDFLARHDTETFPRWYQMSQLILCIGFVVEVIMRISYNGWKFFTKNVHWNYFQIALVFFQVVETAMMLGRWWLGWSSLSRPLMRWFRIVSVSKVLRFFHVLDHLDFTSELHLLLASMSGSLWSLGWSVLFMVLPMFGFGMYLTMVVADFRVNSGIEEIKLATLLHFWGTLERSMMTLFYSISGGLSWSEAVAPLEHCGFVWAKSFYVLYVASMVFAVLNVLTGVFVNSATTAATSEKERRILGTLRKMFYDVDIDQSGNLTHGEFVALLKHKDIGVCLQTLNIHPSQADHLYKLIDADRSGVVSIDEFVEGVFRLQGTLRAVDFASFQIEFQALRAAVRDIITRDTEIHGIKALRASRRSGSSASRAQI
jgi:hypothetical protein